MGTSASKVEAEKNGTQSEDNTSKISAKRLKPSDGVSGWVNVRKIPIEEKNLPSVTINTDQAQLTQLITLTTLLETAIKNGACGERKTGVNIAAAFGIIKMFADHPLTLHNRALLEKAIATTETAYTSHRLFAKSVKDTSPETTSVNEELRAERATL